MPSDIYSVLTLTGSSTVSFITSHLGLGILELGGISYNPEHYEIDTDGVLELSGSGIVNQIINIHSQGILQLGGNPSEISRIFNIETKGYIYLSGITSNESIVDNSDAEYNLARKLFHVDSNENIIIKQAKILGVPIQENNEIFREEITEHKALNSSVAKIDKRKPVRRHNRIYKGDFIESRHVNSLFENFIINAGVIDIALKRLSTEIENAKSAVASQANDLQLDIKKSTGLLDTFGLYTSIINGSISGITESFKTPDSISDSSGKTLFANLDEGILTLTPSTIAEIDLADSDIKISPNSNGDFKPGYDINNAFDGNDITYMHYFQNSAADKLTLQIEIKLSTPEIINNILILSNNFGTQNWLNLEDLSVSSDGFTWINLASNSELKSDNNNNSAESSFTFLPQKIEYLRFRIVQNHKDFSNTYNIGISSIRIQRLSYETSGSIVIKKEIPKSKISAIALHFKEGIYDAQVLKMKFQVSLNSRDWYHIQPVQFNGNTPEIIYINQYWLKDSVNLEETEFENIYVKIFFNKTLVSDALAKLINHSSFRKSVFLEFPNQSPYQIKLNDQIDSKKLTIGALSKLVLGKKTNNFIQLGETNNNQKRYVFDLPLDPKGLEEVVVGNIKLYKAPTLSALYDGYILGYYIDTEKLKLHINLDTAIPVHDKKKLADPWIDISFEPEPVVNTNTDLSNDEQSILSGHDISEILLEQKAIKLFLGYDIIDPDTNVVNLTHLSDGIKENFYLARVDIADGKIVTEEIFDLIPANKTIVKLTSIPVFDTDILVTGGHKVDFIDGAKEFELSGEFAYSIDYNSGYLHLRNSYPVDTTIKYTRYREFSINPNDYDVSEDGKQLIINPRIFDKDSYYKISYNLILPISDTKYTVKPDNRTIELTDVSIINNFIGLDILSNRLLKVTYVYKSDTNDFLQNIFTNISPILSEFDIIYSTN